MLGMGVAGKQGCNYTPNIGTVETLGGNYHLNEPRTVNAPTLALYLRPFPT
jgi:hypothetical protein